MTGNNSPNLIIKYYPENSGVAIFFLCIIYVNNIFLIGLTIGLCYFKIKLVHSSEIDRVYKESITKEVYLKLKDYPDAPDIFIKRYIRMRMIGTISPFLEYNRYISKKRERNKVFTTASGYIFELMSQMKSYELYYSIIDIVIVIFSLFVIYEKEFQKYQYFVFTIFLCSISCLDQIHHFFFKDFFQNTVYWKSYLDLVLNVLIIITSLILFVSPQQIIVIKFWGLFCISKIYRFFILYFKFEKHSLIEQIVIPISGYIFEVIK